MSVLDVEGFNRKLDDFVERVQPKILQFKEFFLGKVLSAVMVCSNDDLLVGAKCSEYPDYLKGKSLQSITIIVED